MNIRKASMIVLASIVFVILAAMRPIGEPTWGRETPTLVRGSYPWITPTPAKGNIQYPTPHPTKGGFGW